MLLLLIISCLIGCEARTDNYYMAVNNLEKRNDATNLCESFVRGNTINKKIPILSRNLLTITRWIEFSNDFCIPILKKDGTIFSDETLEQFIERRNRDYDNDELIAKQNRKWAVNVVLTILSVVAVFILYY